MEPVTLESIKQQLEIEPDNATWDILLGAYIPAAREYIENRSQQVLVQRPFVEYRAAFGDYIELMRRPLVAVNSLTYLDQAGASAEVTGFVIQQPNRIYPPGGGFPAIQSGSNITVAYLAGYDDGAAPFALQQAIRMCVGHWFAQRETVAYGLIPSEVPHGVNAICDITFPGFV